MDGDSYSHDSYTLLQATGLIHEAVEHVLSQEGSEVSRTLQKELREWRDCRGKEDSVVVEDVACRHIEFELVTRIHKQLQSTPMERGPVFLHELVEGTELILPAIKPPKRNPELVARLEKIRARAEQKEYNRMVGNVDPNISRSHVLSLGLELQSTSRQLCAMVNFLLTVVGSFVFGYFAASFAGFEVPSCVFMGLLFGIAVFIADLYFLVKVAPAPAPLRTEKTHVQ